MKLMILSNLDWTRDMQCKLLLSLTLQDTQDSGVPNVESFTSHEMMERVTASMGMLAFGASLPNYMVCVYVRT